MLYLRNFLTELAVKKELKLLRKLVFLFFLFSFYPLVFAAAVIFAFGAPVFGSSVTAASAPEVPGCCTLLRLVQDAAGETTRISFVRLVKKAII